MPRHDIDPVATLRQVMGRSSPPATVTQKAFDFENGHLHRLARLKPGERAVPGDLWDYTQDLRYTEIQAPLLAYLIPFCLQAWREDVRGTHTGYGGFVEDFYPVLADRHVFDMHLTPRQTAAVSEFMRQSILDEIDDQRGLAYQGVNARPYRWVRALTTFGVLLPDIEPLWMAWWSLDTIGRAVSFIQYISALMYKDDKNPIFAPWTRDGGGGPPCLWEYEGHLYTHRWLEPNVDFLKRTLTVSAVSDGLRRAVERLTNEPEHDMAARVHREFSARAEMLERRCGGLPAFLETAQEPDKWPTWSV